MRNCRIGSLESQKRWAIVTGASSGIGRATALALAQAGYPVVLAARSIDKLTRLRRTIESSGGTALAMAVDLGREGDLREFSERVMRLAEPVDLLINNAGLAWYGYSESMPWEIACEMMAVNNRALVELTWLFLPEMKRRGRGHIINVGSIAGSIPSQGVALYSATKAFVDAFTTGLHRELQGSGVHASVVRAGAVATPFFDRAAAQERGRQIPARKLAIAPERVAQAILRLVRRPRRVAYVPSGLALVPWIELAFGWAMDLIGPRLLRARSA